MKDDKGLPRPTYLFAGPSLWADEAVARPVVPAGITLLSPAARGDIPTLLERHKDGRAGVLLLADGRFHHGSAAVGHAELGAALEAGWDIWGVSSLGALRAWEMRHLGMRGWGAVYAQLQEADRIGADFRDDELALLHEPEPPYRPISEPLIHLRAALDDWLSPEAARRTAAALEALWFGDRTLVRAAVLIAAERGLSEEAMLSTLRRDFDRFRIKTADLRSLLQERPWENRGAVTDRKVAVS